MKIWDSLFGSRQHQLVYPASPLFTNTVCVTVRICVLVVFVLLFSADFLTVSKIKC